MYFIIRFLFKKKQQISYIPSRDYIVLFSVVPLLSCCFYTHLILKEELNVFLDLMMTVVGRGMYYSYTRF